MALSVFYTFSDSLPKIEAAVHDEYRFGLSGVSGSSVMRRQRLLVLLEFGSCRVLTRQPHTHQHTMDVHVVTLSGIWGCYDAILKAY